MERYIPLVSMIPEEERYADEDRNDTVRTSKHIRPSLRERHIM